MPPLCLRLPRKVQGERPPFRASKWSQSALSFVEGRQLAGVSSPLPLARNARSDKFRMQAIRVASVGRSEGSGWVNVESVRKLTSSEIGVAGQLEGAAWSVHWSNFALWSRRLVSPRISLGSNSTSSSWVSIIGRGGQLRRSRHHSRGVGCRSGSRVS